MHPLLFRLIVKIEVEAWWCLESRISIFSRKQKLNDGVAGVLWSCHFIKGQGYKVQECIIFQDNTSATSLEKNGKAINSKFVKHISVRYFFIHDMIQKGKVSIEYCPMEKMWADVLTKSLQGQKFWETWSIWNAQWVITRWREESKRKRRNLSEQSCPKREFYWSWDCLPQTACHQHRSVM